MPTGGKLRDHYAIGARRRGFMLPEECDLPLPECLTHLMEWFADLSNGRGSTGFALNPLTYSEIESWARLRDIRVTPFEAQALKDIDMVYLSVAMKRDDEPTKEPRHGG